MNMPDYYRLRWRFDYSDHKPSKYGMWSRDPDNPNEKACFQSKDNLRRAVIEGKHIRTFEIVTLAECDGWDFCNFQWMAEFRARANDIAGTAFCRHVGLKIVTRECWIEVGFHGGVNKIPRTEQDKNFHYAGYGR